jgi:hypothetical protein
MSFNLTHLRSLEQFSVSIPKDDEGYVGRECPQPDCEGYFKIKPGTGLKGANLPCFCPYCGHQDPPGRFFTKAQVEYAKSIAIREISDALRKDLKQLEFEHKPRGSFGIGISMKLKPGSPLPIRYYREQQLETKVTCDGCTLEYAVFGVFAFCPDCAVHNSLLILRKNLDLTRRQLDLADKLEDPALRQHFTEDALENCVSAFDGFAREACRVRTSKSTEPSKCTSLSFQNLPRALAQLKKLFGVDLTPALLAPEWKSAHTAFMQRHLVAHKAGVIDQQYLDETGESSSHLGRRLSVPSDRVRDVADTVMKIGEYLIATLPPPK